MGAPSRSFCSHAILLMILLLQTWGGGHSVKTEKTSLPPRTLENLAAVAPAVENTPKDTPNNDKLHLHQRKVIYMILRTPQNLTATLPVHFYILEINAVFISSKDSGSKRASAPARTSTASLSSPNPR